MTHKHIEFLSITHLRGPNMWTWNPVLEALVDIGELEDFPSNKIPGFYERLTAWLPTLIEHRCSYDERGGFLRRLKEGTWPGHIMEHVVLEIQGLAGMPGGFGRAREISKRGVYKVVVTCWQKEVTTRALYGGRDLVMAAIEDRPFDVKALVDELREMADDLCLGPSTNSIVVGAAGRSIPSIRLTEGNLVQLGYGARQRRIWTAETDRTSAIAEGISRDKDLTKRLLASCGVPVPEGRIVDDAADAWEAAQDVGVPVVVKPCDANHGRGVCIDLSTPEEIATAFGIAQAEGSGVMVERFIRGSEHRVLVVGGRMVAAARGDAAVVTGDGRSTVLELIDTQLNTDPMRGFEEEFPLNPVRLDATARLELSRQGLTGDSIPEAGRSVMVQRNGNVALDVTDMVHPDVAETAALAARIVGLDIAGIDIVALDIRRPLGEQGGAIVEVNAGPGLAMHVKPANGPARPVGRAIADHLFPADDDGRIPIVGISGTHGRTQACRLVAHLLHLGGSRVGLACSEGLYMDRRRIFGGDRTDFDSARRLLMNRMIDAAVIENVPRLMTTEGVSYDRGAVGVVLRMDPTMLMPDLYIDDDDLLFKVVRTQVDVVLPSGAAVLNAADPKVAEMAELCEGDVIFFALDELAQPLAAHLADGRRAVLIRHGRIMLVTGQDAQELCELSQVPMACADSGGIEVIENLLACVGAAWALGLPKEIIRTGIETFDPLDPTGVGAL